MIILRSRKRNPGDLYFVSTFSDLNGEIIKPKVPNNFLTKNKIGDYKTPRICFYPSVDKALVALSQELKGKELYIYQPRNINFDSLHKPNISEVPSCLLTDEFWYLDQVELRYLAAVKVEGKEKELAYHYGPRSTKAYLYKWKWEEILKPWEKEGKLKEKK